jgi:EpsI family protein
MPEPKGRKASLAFAGMIAVLSSLVCAGLIMAAMGDGVWEGRMWGFMGVVLSLAVAGLICIRSRPGDTHYWGMVSALTIAALLTGGYAYRPTAPKLGSRAETIPKIINGWAGISQEVDEKTMDVLGTTDIIMRRYRKGTDVVNLAVIFAEGSRKVAHPPEQCYTAEGREFSEIEPDSFQTKDGRTINGTRLIFVGTQSGRGQAVLYTYKANDLYTSDFLMQQLYVIWCNLTMQTGTRVALIRLTSPLPTLADKPEAMARIKTFAREVFPEVEKALDSANADKPDDKTVASTSN